MANRLPATAKRVGDRIVLAPSTGGLATALRGVHATGDTLWIGWPGCELSASDAASLEGAFAKLGAVPIALERAEIERFYDGFANGVLWPLFHYLIDKVNLDAQSDWESYRNVNARFADAVAALHRRGDRIWVHDYQLALVPELLRERLPDAEIGFFLHTPFPSADVFRILPWRTQLLRGMLGADLVGFHTDGYRNHFASCVRHVLGVECDGRWVDNADRRIALEVFPIGIDAARFDELARSQEVATVAEGHRVASGGQRILLGVDRLDYTKGILRRLLAFERLLEREPSWAERVRLVQVGVPTRESVGAYEDFREAVEGAVSRINGRFGSVGNVPIHFLRCSVSEAELVALYRAADVMLVTPLRDGMNLVAKEYVASRVDDDGVLVLSEFAGAAAELSEALIVNPYDVEAMAVGLREALTMPREVRRLRMRAMRRHVASTDAAAWARGFLDAMSRRRAPSVAPSPPEPGPAIVRELGVAKRRVVLLDYDGTLVRFERTPDLAAPDAELCDLLERLVARPATEVHIVSGRRRDSLEAWFGGGRLGLHAEDGYWSRLPGASVWTHVSVETEWKATVRPLLEYVASRIAGSFVEEKGASLAWHYRVADPDTVQRELRGLRRLLARTLSEHDVELVDGAKLVEIRAKGLDQAAVVRRVLGADHAGVGVLAMGRDEVLFGAAGAEAVTVRVGAGPSSARYGIADHAAARRLLRAVADASAPRATVDVARAVDAEP